jgi:hypothetical protein
MWHIYHDFSPKTRRGSCRNLDVRRAAPATADKLTVGTGNLCTESAARPRQIGGFTDTYTISEG